MVRILFSAILLFPITSNALTQAEQLAAAQDAVDSAFTSNSTVLLNITAGQRSETANSFTKKYFAMTGVKSSCTLAYTETRTVLFAGSDGGGDFYYELVTQLKKSGTCAIDLSAPRVNKRYKELPDASDMTGDWLAAIVAKVYNVTALWQMDTSSEVTDGYAGAKYNLNTNMLFAEVESKSEYYGSDSDFSWLVKTTSKTKALKPLLQVQLKALADTLTYINYCDESNSCSDGQAVNLATNGSTMTIGAGVAPTSSGLTTKICKLTNPIKAHYASCDNSASFGACAEYYGPAGDWTGAEAACTSGGGTWSINACPKVSNDDNASGQLAATTIAASCVAGCTPTAVTVMYSYATPVTSTLRKAAQAAAKANCTGALGKHTNL